MKRELFAKVHQGFGSVFELRNNIDKPTRVLESRASLQYPRLGVLGSFGLDQVARFRDNLRSQSFLLYG